MTALTVDDFMAIPEGPPYYELVEGRLCELPLPLLIHQTVVGNVVRLLHRFLRDQPIGEVLFAPCGVFLDQMNVYLPDVLFVRHERLSILGEQGVEGAPNLIVEVISHSTERRDKGAKKKIYAATGVQELWLVDPRAQELAVFYLQESVDTPKITVRANGRFESPLFPRLTLHGMEIFRDPRRKSVSKKQRKS